MRVVIDAIPFIPRTTTTTGPSLIVGRVGGPEARRKAESLLLQKSMSFLAYCVMYFSVQSPTLGSTMSYSVPAATKVLRASKLSW